MTASGLPLSDTAKERVEDFIECAIARVEDASRKDHAAFEKRSVLW